MFLKNIDENSVEVAYLCEYLSKSKFYTGEHDYRDNRSIDFVLAFKRKKEYAIKMAFDEIYPQLGDDFAIAVVPPSSVNNNFNTACHRLCDLIIKRAQANKKNIIDASHCLKRTSDVPSKHLTPGRRSSISDRWSINVVDEKIIHRKNVLLIDDIVTSGNSIKTCKDALRRAGANKIMGLTVGKTVSVGSLQTVLKYGFILDLDQTLFDTDHIKQYRDNQQWKTARDLANDLEVDPQIEKLISYIKNKLRGEICIVTKSSRSYAKVLAHKLGIDNRHVIAYSDCEKQKPDPQQYFRAKQIMGIYEGCTIVIGDNYTDLKPGRELGMTTVQACWYNKTAKKSAYADFRYTSIDTLLKNMPHILAKANELREKITTDADYDESPILKEAQLLCQIKSSYNITPKTTSCSEDLTTKEFKEKYDIHLNQQQEDALKSIDGANLLLAVPGSGKTTVLVSRIGYMILVKKINPDNILALTFNTQAAAEMSVRFAKKFGEELGNKVKFQTIHKLCYTIYQEYCKNTNRPIRTILKDSALNGLLGNIYRKNHKNQFVSRTELTEMQNVFSYIKNMMLNLEDIKKINDEENNWSKMYQEYKDYLFGHQLMDFDDMLAFSYWILSKKPHILEAYRQQYQYICVDEAQDNSKIQNAIIKLLSKDKNIFMVGDEDQSIYGFRGAFPEALLNFQEDYPNAKLLLMEKNYRSTERIVNLAQAFISRNINRHEKHMVSSRELGKDIKIISTFSRRGQYLKYFKDIKNRTHELAFLYRDNSSAIPLVDFCIENNIPLTMKRPDNNFFTNKVVTEIKAYLNLAINPYDISSFKKINGKGVIWANNGQKSFVQRHCSPIKSTTVVDALEQYGTNMQQVNDLSNLLDSLENATARQAIKLILNAGYSNYLKKNKVGSDAVEILDILASDKSADEDTPPRKVLYFTTRRHGEFEEITDDKGLTIKEFLEHLDKLEKKFLEGFNDTEGNPVKLSTIHSSKGLEYDTVYVIDVYNGKFPSTQSHPFSALESNADIEQEERRLFYVAITRAKNELFLGSVAGIRSKFISEFQ